LKWQDALVALLWATALFSLIGCAFTLRFLYALHIGYARGILMLVQDKFLVVRDLSLENLVSGFWMMHAGFWCFVAVLLGLFPEMLLGWTLHIPQPILAVLATGAAILLGIAGLAVSAVFGSFIMVGCIGAISFCRNLGAERMYPLNDHTTLRLDAAILTLIYPGKQESILDLESLDLDDRDSLLALLGDHLDIQHYREEQEEAVSTQAEDDVVVYSP
jgi:hypothetical protein